MKNRINTTCFREIKSSFKRFLSLLVMSMLGVGVFVGISMAAPSMMKSIDEYYDDSNYYDVKLISTLGFSDENIEDIKKLDSVKEVYGSNSKDVLLNTGENESVVKLIGLNEDINMVEITSGTKPKNNGEIVVEEALLKKNNLKIGSYVSIANDDSFKKTKLKIVGTVKSPLYINAASSSSDRGNTNLGTGKINYYAYTPNDNFNLDYYTEAYVTVKGAKEKLTNSENYNKLVDNALNEIEDIKNNLQEQRYNEIYTEANNEILENEKEGINELNNAKTILDSSNSKLNETKKTLKLTKLKLDNASNELSKNKSLLDDFKKELDSSNLKLIDSKNQIDNAINEVNNKLAPYNLTYDELMNLNNNLYDEEVTKPIIVSLVPTDLENYDDIIKLIDEVYDLGLDDEIIDLIKGDVTKDEIINNIPSDSPNYELIVKLINGVSYFIENGYLTDPNNIEMIINVIPKDIPNYDKIIGILNFYKDNIESINDFSVYLQTIQNAKNEYENGLNLYNDMLSKYNDSYNQYVYSYNEYQNGLSQYNNGVISYNNGLNLYNDSVKEYYNAKTVFENKINDAKKSLEEIPSCEIYTYNRLDDSNYSEFINDSDSIANLSKVFPTIFFVVAILISLISMSRMVEDDRLQIGTLKSLGFNNKHIRKKYLLYSGIATLSGSLLGSILGMFFLPQYIWNIYKIIFDIPNFSLNYDFTYIIIGVLIAFVCICGTTLLTIRKVVKEKPSELMRPKAPANGKRVLLERIPFIWKRLKFSNKVIVRNIFRDKNRVIMTIVGIMGCTGLMLTGFGIRDSIVNIPSYQYGQVFKYTDMVYINEEASSSDIDNLLDNDLIKNHVNTRVITGSSNGYSINIFVPENEKDLSNILELSDLETGKSLNLKDNEIIITDKLADLTGSKKGNELTFKDSNGVPHTFKISGVCENYVGHYVFLNKETYENNFGEYSTNVSFVNVNKLKNENKLNEELLESNTVMTVISINSTIRTIDGMLKSLDSVVLILIVLSACLSFVVLYNLSYINISERKREIATLKVLGFTDKEVDDYINKETMILTIIGILFGLVFGILLTNIIIDTVEIEMVRFIRHINVVSFIISSLITIIFTVIVIIITHYSLKKIDMIESLKSVE